MLTIRELTKAYGGGIQALKGVSLDVSPGVFGLLGPNGAGKTTLMKILATLLEPDAGTVEMNGFDLINRKDKRGDFSVTCRRTWSIERTQSFDRCSGMVFMARVSILLNVVYARNP